MEHQTIGMGTVEQLAEKLSQYFGSEYEISTNNVDVVTIRSGLKPSVYFESEDILIVSSIVRDHGWMVDKWRIVVANQQVAIYFVLAEPPARAAASNRGTGRLAVSGNRATV